MRLLLDTHILLWLMLDAIRLPASAKELIEEAETVLVSSVSLWEIAIKRSIGKLQLDERKLDAAIERAGLEPLAVAWAHVRAVRELPLHHRDPFDRLLLAQAIAEPLHLLTHDAALSVYSPRVIVV